MQHLRSAFLATVAAASALFSSVALAGPLAGSTVTIATDLGIGFGLGQSTCKSGDDVDVVGAGVELGATDYVGGCRGLVTVDVADSLFTVTGLRQSGVGDYRWLTLAMDFSGAGPITGVSLLSQSLFRADAHNPAPVISFDIDTISVSWDSSSSAQTLFQLADGGSAAFAVTTRGAVPEPASLALVGFGIAALGVRRRKMAR